MVVVVVVLMGWLVGMVERGECEGRLELYPLRVKDVDVLECI